MTSLARAHLARTPGQFRTAFSGVGTVITVIGQGETDANLAQRLRQEVADAEASLSRFAPNSDISRLNRGDDWVQLTQCSAEVLNAAIDYAESTDGIVTPLIGRLMQLWDVRTWLSALAAGATPQPPPSRAIAAARASCDLTLLRRRGAREFRLDGGALVDLGAIAKGWIADRLRQVAHAGGLSRVLVSVGQSSISTRTAKPAWRVGIRAVSGPPDVIAGRIELADASLSTSGDYLQTLPQLVAGHVVHHIIDPRSGYPATSDIRQATVVAPDGMQAEVASTYALITGASPTPRFPATQTLLATATGYHASDDLAWYPLSR
ncbi:MAG: FAD:protein FMN transferase [Bowdeniella nasicola]|nr:FAD:protein FMN transferase [Bowdeniella nasicola]